MAWTALRCVARSVRRRCVARSVRRDASEGGASEGRRAAWFPIVWPGSRLFGRSARGSDGVQHVPGSAPRARSRVDDRPATATRACHRGGAAPTTTSRASGDGDAGTGARGCRTRCAPSSPQSSVWSSSQRAARRLQPGNRQVSSRTRSQRARSAGGRYVVRSTSSTVPEIGCVRIRVNDGACAARRVRSRGRSGRSPRGRRERHRRRAASAPERSRARSAGRLPPRRGTLRRSAGRRAGAGRARHPLGAGRACARLRC